MKTETALFIPLKRKFFEDFKAGIKKNEYRPYGPRWNEKTCRIGRRVTLSLGYGKQNRLSGTVVSFGKNTLIPTTQVWKECYGDNTHYVAASIGIRLDDAK